MSHLILTTCEPVPVAANGQRRGRGMPTMPDVIGVLVIARMAWGTVCVFATAFGPPPPRRHRPDDPTT